MRVTEVVSTSVKPAMAASTRNASLSWLRGSSLPAFHMRGSLLAMLLYPYAIATSW